MPSEMCILIFVTTILIKRETHPASYILMESMLCLFKPVTSFSSELAQLPKKEKKTKGKKKKEKRTTNGNTTAKPEDIPGTARLPTLQTQKRLFPKPGVTNLRAIVL